jgi:IS1 family transposase
MEAQIYRTKVAAVEAAAELIENNNLTGVLRPSAIVQTVTLNQIHATMIVGDDRRAYMVMWPDHDDLVSYYQEAADQAKVIRDRHAALKQKIAEIEADNSWLNHVEEPVEFISSPTESADKVLTAPAPTEAFVLNQTKNGDFEVATTGKPSAW